MHKLKYVKEKLEIWNLEVCGDVRVWKKELLLEIDSIDSFELKRVMFQRSFLAIEQRLKMSWN